MVLAHMIRIWLLKDGLQILLFLSHSDSTTRNNPSVLDHSSTVADIAQNKLSGNTEKH